MNSMLSPPINLKKWIDENRELLNPPVCNKVVYEDGEFIIMVVGGPNSRKDYHIDEGEEFFYQIEGNMILRIIENNKIGIIDPAVIAPPWGRENGFIKYNTEAKATNTINSARIFLSIFKEITYTIRNTKIILIFYLIDGY